MLEVEGTDIGIKRLSKDLKEAAKTLSENEVRFLVDAYYTMQENRIRTNNQRQAIDCGSDAGTSHLLLDWLSENDAALEAQIKRALDSYSLSRPLGEWARSIVGIGPVIASGLLAHIDIRKCPTVGHIWRFAGLDPTMKWIRSSEVASLVSELAASVEKNSDTDAPLEELLLRASQQLGRNPDCIRSLVERTGKSLSVKTLQTVLARRPFNASLKTLCWKLGESFVKVSGNEKDVYGKIYLARKLQETEKNEAGLFAEQAAQKLEKFKIGKDTDAYAAYKAGKLPKAHLHARAKRYAVKMFLSHYHAVGFMLEFRQEPPKPFAIVHLGHAHEIKPPHWEELKALLEKEDL